VTGVVMSGVAGLASCGRGLHDVSGHLCGFVLWSVDQSWETSVELEERCLCYYLLRESGKGSRLWRATAATLMVESPLVPNLEPSPPKGTVNAGVRQLEETYV
jgi:hypothetical protein